MENCVSTDAVVKEFPWLTGYQLSNVLYFDEFDRKSFSERQWLTKLKVDFIA